MELLFWIGVVWVGYVYVGYPLLLALVALVARVHPVVDDDFLPTVSVLISARNEERDMCWKVAETLAWDYPRGRIEVLVASDASDDRTDEILRGIEDRRLTFLRIEKRGGKIRALNRLVQRAKGELLFFTDANAHIEPGCLRKMVRHFADERVGCVTGISHSLEEPRSTAITSGAAAYLDYESAINRLESEIGSVLVCDGAIHCLRSALYRPLAPELANDLELPLRIGHAGRLIRYEPEARAFEKETSSPWEEFRRRRRICAQGVLGMWRLKSTITGLRGWQFVSRKFLRWLTLVPLLLILISSVTLAGRPVFAALLGLQTVFYGFALVGLISAALGGKVHRLFAIPFYVLLGSAGALAGLVETCFGRRFDVWESAALSRGTRDAHCHSVQS